MRFEKDLRIRAELFEKVVERKSFTITGNLVTMLVNDALSHAPKTV